MGYWSDIDVLMQDAAIGNLTLLIQPWWLESDPFGPVVALIS